METPFEDLAELIKDIPDELLASSLVRLVKATVSSDNKRDYASICVYTGSNVGIQYQLF